MKKLLAAAVLALSLSASPAGAAGWPPFKVEVSGNFHCRIYNPQCNPAQLGPWYQYWPLEAHFQAPAKVAYPYWPSQQTLPTGTATVPFQTIPTPQGAGHPANFHPGGIKPISYGRTPGHWYGR
jgi:hypothetical protein